MITRKYADLLAERYARKRNWKCILTEETEHYYVYVPATMDDELIGNSSSITVNKETGEVKLKHFREMMDENTIREF